MQNNVKLLAIRYLPGLVLLGGGWEEGLGRWGCQDPQLKGGKERRNLTSALVLYPGGLHPRVGFRALVEVAA